jgi:hypothetical protein
MSKRFKIVAFFVLMMPALTWSQPESSKYLPDKPGKWSFRSNINSYGPEYAAMAKNAAVLAEWFHQNIPILTNPEGFDLSAVLFGSWDDNYKKRACNYGVRGELNFDFQLFLSNGGIWTVEPPHFSFDINNTETGHGTNSHWNGFDYRYDAPELEGPMEKAADDLNDLFSVFPLEKEISPGVSLFGDGHLVVFNPDRPPFWVPVTLREFAKMTLDYYTIFKSKEMGEMMLDELKKELAELNEEELNAPACQGDENHFVLNANGKNQGLQIMSFNTEYWDRSLPPSAIQFMTLRYPDLSQAETYEYFLNNGHPHFGQLVMQLVNLDELHGLIMRKK